VKKSKNTEFYFFLCFVFSIARIVSSWLSPDVIYKRPWYEIEG